MTVRQVALDGAPHDWLHWLQPIANRVSGQCLDINAINQLVASLTDELVARGFVTSRVYVPEQNLKSGTLRLIVVPGRIQAIRLQDGDSDLSLRAAFPAGPGDILNLRDLEQGLEQLGRPSSQQATMEILPGDAPGESIVSVKRLRTRPVHLQLSEDNSGQMATGKNQLSAQVSADNVIGINDVLSVSQSQDADEVAHPRSKSQSASWLFPWGKWTGYLSFSTFDYYQTVDTGQLTFQSRGLSRNSLFSLTRLLDRDQNSKTELALLVTHKAMRSFIEDQELVGQRQELSYLGLQLNRRQYLGAAQLDGSLSYTRGMSMLGAQTDSLASQGGPGARPEIYGASLSLAAPLPWAGLRYNTALKGQYSPHPLFGTDQFSVGGHYSVRGFDANSLAAQSGWTWRNDLIWPVAMPFGALEFYAGLDAGQVSDQTAQSVSTSRLTGAALGVRTTIANHLTAEISHEQPISCPGSWPRQSITYFSLALLW